MRKNTFKFRWRTALILLSIHGLASYAILFNFSWPLFWLAFGVEFVGCCLGVGIGLHRLFTHGGFKASQSMTRFLGFCSCFAAQGGPIEWVSTHRRHHDMVDTEDDPHSPIYGFWWAHVGWILYKDPYLGSPAALKRYAPRLLRDPFLVAMNQYWWVPPVTWGIMLWGIFGFNTALWGTVVPITFGLHFTWLVNSGAHKWGRRRFNETRDRSTNNWLIALLTWGDGWHNNHHAYPTSAKHAWVWHDIDVSWYTIWFLYKMGKISDLQLHK